VFSFKGRQKKLLRGCCKAGNSLYICSRFERHGGAIPGDLEAAFCGGLRAFQKSEKFLKKNLENQKKAFYFAAAKRKNVLCPNAGDKLKPYQSEST
jgi:hypothetical protein